MRWVYELWIMTQAATSLALLRACGKPKEKAAFLWGDKESHNTTTARLKVGIKETKRRHQHRRINSKKKKNKKSTLPRATLIIHSWCERNPTEGKHDNRLPGLPTSLVGREWKTSWHFLTHHCHRKLFPPASRQGPPSTSPKIPLAPLLKYLG